MMTFCSTASHLPSGMIARACLVCSGVTLYGTTPMHFSNDSFSISGPSAATTTGQFSAPASPFRMPSRYLRIAGTGFSYTCPRSPSTIGTWLTPRPRIKRSPYRSRSVM